MKAIDVFALFFAVTGGLLAVAAVLLLLLIAYKMPYMTVSAGGSTTAAWESYWQARRRAGVGVIAALANVVYIFLCLPDIPKDAWWADWWNSLNS